MSEAAALVPLREEWAAVGRLVLDAVRSPLTRRLYSKALDEFFAWWEAEGRPSFSRAAVQAHRAWLEEQGHGPATINQRLAAIKKLAREAAANNLVDAGVAAAIKDVPGAKLAGDRAGNWLSRDQAQALLELPDAGTLKGKRDRAALGLLVGCALRRSEAAGLNVEDVQQRDGRWVIPDLAGKHGRIRTVPVPAWVKQGIDEWTVAAAIDDGRILRAMNRHGRIVGESMSPQAILDLVSAYGQKLGVKLRAHDARRTCAKLCRGSGADLEQIQLLLGHRSVQTTERYLGTRQDLVEAANDRLGLRWPAGAAAPAAPPSAPPPPEEKERTTTVELWLRVENNNKFVRGKKRARLNIERFHLARYGIKKLSECRYELTFSYIDDADLDDRVHDLLQVISSEADLRYCFVETYAREKGTDRHW